MSASVKCFERERRGREMGLGVGSFGVGIYTRSSEYSEIGSLTVTVHVITGLRM